MLFDPLGTSVQFAGVNVPTFESFPTAPLATTARTATALTAGTATTNESVATAMSTKLFKMTVPAQPSLVTLVLTGVGTDLRPRMRVHDKTGKTLGGLLVSATAGAKAAGVTIGYPVDGTMNDGDVYVTLFDQAFGGAATNFGFTLTPTIVPIDQTGQVGEKATANETTTDAQVLAPATLPNLITGDTTTATDRDLYAINLTQGDRPRSRTRPRPTPRRCASAPVSPRRRARSSRARRLARLARRLHRPVDQHLLPEPHGRRFGDQEDRQISHRAA